MQVVTLSNGFGAVDFLYIRDLKAESESEYACEVSSLGSIQIPKGMYQVKTPVVNRQMRLIGNTRWETVTGGVLVYRAALVFRFGPSPWKKEGF